MENTSLYKLIERLVTKTSHKLIISQWNDLTGDSYIIAQFEDNPHIYLRQYSGHICIVYGKTNTPEIDEVLSYATIEDHQLEAVVDITLKQYSNWVTAETCQYSLKFDQRTK